MKSVTRRDVLAAFLGAPLALAACRTKKRVPDGEMAQLLEGDVTPLPMAGIFEFPTLADALAFYQSSEYAPIKIERDAAQEARLFVVDAG